MVKCGRLALLGYQPSHTSRCSIINKDSFPLSLITFQNVTLLFAWHAREMYGKWMENVTLNISRSILPGSHFEISASHEALKVQCDLGSVARRSVFQRPVLDISCGFSMWTTHPCVGHFRTRDSSGKPINTKMKKKLQVGMANIYNPCLIEIRWYQGHLRTFTTNVW